eukprot:3585034-Karenia_brevis.AAC.1
MAMYESGICLHALAACSCKKQSSTMTGAYAGHWAEEGVTKMSRDRSKEDVQRKEYQRCSEEG